MKEIVKKLPVVPYVYRFLRQHYIRTRLKKLRTDEVFTYIFRGKGNKWGVKESYSGSGSNLYQTRVIIKELPVIFNELNISTVLDIPCGDFHWMKAVDMKNIDYIGADIVEQLIHHNKEKYEKEYLHFRKLDLTKDRLPKVDLIFCRDCLVHLSFRDIFMALYNICSSESKYLLTTTFPGRKDNCDILTGEWRPLNLTITPFDFPNPLKTIHEECTEDNGAYSDKSLGLWKIEDIKKSLIMR